MKIAYRFAAALVAVAVGILAVMAYFITTDPSKTPLHDGLGRELYVAPFFLRMAGIPDYPGLVWFLGDTVIAMIAFAICCLLWQKSKYEE